MLDIYKCLHSLIPISFSNNNYRVGGHRRSQWNEHRSEEIKRYAFLV